MKQKEIFEKVKDIIMDKTGLDDEDVKLESEFREDLGTDSLDEVELIMEFEREFDISIPDEDAEKVITVNDAVQYLSKVIKTDSK